MKARAAFGVMGGLSLATLYYANLHSFLLFHVLIELFSVVVAFAIFMFAWNTRDNIANSSLILLGSAYLCVGAVDLLHTVAYKGMGVLPTSGADTATQLWIAARYIEGLSLAAAPLAVGRRIRMPQAMGLYAGLFLLVIAVIFIWPVFPACFVEGAGLTPFKKISEYIIIVLLLIGLGNLVRKRAHFEGKVFRLLTAGIVLTIASETLFTVYINVYGISNLVGHLFKLGSFWLIYKAIIETGLQEPYALLFRELARSEKRYRDLVDHLPSGICEIDGDFRIRYINPAGLDLIGYTQDDIRKGIDLNTILDARDQDKAQNRFDELRQHRPLDSAGYRLRRKDGAVADVLVNSTPVYRGGELQAIRTSITDVTELHRLHTRLQEARKMEAVAMLAGGMAHEINNVLMGVVGGIELLKLNMADGEVSDSDFRQVLRGCDRIAGLIKRLLAYSRGGRYRSEAIDMAVFIKGWLPEIEKQISPEIQLTYTAADRLPAITADPTQIEMVVSEVVTNAVEALDGAGRIEIDLQLRGIDGDRSGQEPALQPGRYIRFRVRDTGKGMDAEALAHIFEPFYTAHIPGRGMGLPAVYGIVKNHGGWIGVDSEPGRGTTVQIYLPVDRPEAPAPAENGAGDATRAALWR